MKIEMTYTKNGVTMKKTEEREIALIMKHLEQHPEPLELQALAARTNIKKAYLCVLLNELIQQGRVVVKKIPREGTTLHGFLPPFIWKYTIKRDEPAPEPAPEPLVSKEGETAAGQVSATTERVRTRERIAYDEGFEAGRAEEKKNHAKAKDTAYDAHHDADGYHVGYKQGKLDFLHHEMPVREQKSWREGYNAGKVEGHKECRQMFAKKVLDFFHVDTEEKQ